MPPAVVYDGLRTVLGTSLATPRGLDRVDHAFARYFADRWPGDCFGLMPNLPGMRLYDRDLSRQLLVYAENLWRENGDAQRDRRYTGFRERLLHGSPLTFDDPPRRRRHPLAGIPGLVRHFGVRLGASAIRHAPPKSIYLNIGQVTWAYPFVTHWLRRRPDIRAVFMLHDVIPIERPDITRMPKFENDWTIRTIVQRAAGLITTTQAASEAAVAILRRHGLPDIPVCPLHLPVADVFFRKDYSDELLSEHPYFLVCGSFEYRKNLSLLLRVWQRLVEVLGAKAPLLVFAGTLEKSGEPFIRQLRADPALQQYVTVLSGLSSPGLRQLMRNARALLMPSLAEGFGLPVVEALALGTPVLASDIPAHREIGEDFALYLDPGDDSSWYEAIADLIGNPERGANLRRKIGAFQPMSEASYFAQIQLFLESIR